MEVLTLGVGTLTAGVLTLTTGVDTSTLGNFTFALGNEMPTPGTGMLTPGSGRLRFGAVTDTAGDPCDEVELCAAVPSEDDDPMRGSGRLMSAASSAPRLRTNPPHWCLTTHLATRIRPAFNLGGHLPGDSL